MSVLIKLVFLIIRHSFSFEQMEVVDVCAGGLGTQNLDTMAELSPLLISLITEGIALNTNGSVYHPEVQSYCQVLYRSVPVPALNLDESALID